MWPENIKYDSNWEVYKDWIPVHSLSQDEKNEVFSYAVQCFRDNFWKNIPNLLDIWISSTIEEEHGWCEEKRSDWCFRDHEIWSVRMSDVQGWDWFSIEWYPLGDYSQKELDSLFDYIVDSLRRNEFKNTLLSLLQQADDEAVEDPDDWNWYNPHEQRD